MSGGRAACWRGGGRAASCSIAGPRLELIINNKLPEERAREIWNPESF